MNINTELSEVGSNLRRYAEMEAEFSARGVINELFPYICGRRRESSLNRRFKRSHLIQVLSFMR